MHSEKISHSCASSSSSHSLLKYSSLSLSASFSSSSTSLSLSPILRKMYIHTLHSVRVWTHSAPFHIDRFSFRLDHHHTTSITTSLFSHFFLLHHLHSTSKYHWISPFFFVFLLQTSDLQRNTMDGFLLPSLLVSSTPFFPFFFSAL